MNYTTDINLCYRKVFEILGDKCTIRELVDTISEHTGTAIIVLDIVGQIQTFSDSKPGCVDKILNALNQGDALMEFMFACMDKGDVAFSYDFGKDFTDSNILVRTVSVQGTNQYICIVAQKENRDASVDEVELHQVGEIICKSVPLLRVNMDTGRTGSASVLKRIMARILLEKGYQSDVHVSQIREMYESEVTGGFVEAIIRPETMDMDTIQIIEQFGESEQNLFFYIKENEVYFLYTKVTSGDRIYRRLEEFCEKYNMYCGISELFTDRDLIGEKRFLLRQALLIGKREKKEVRVHYEYDYYLRAVLSCATGVIGRGKYMEKELIELKNEDSQKGTELYPTLKIYLMNGTNVSATARALFIHRNTMIYRLGRISTVLGVNINDPAVGSKLLVTILLQEQELLEE